MIKLMVAGEGDPPAGEENRVDYLPFAVKTLKVSVDGRYRGKLRLHPKRLSSRHGQGEKFAHEDAGTPPQFIVSWGGGHEAYFELDYPKKRFAYFLIHHVGNKLDDRLLTIEVEDGSGKVASLPVMLTYPREQGIRWPAEDLVRPEWQELVTGLAGESNILLAGRYVPDYISRWWPGNRVVYDAYGAPPPRVRLHYRRLTEDDGDSGRLNVYATPAAGGGEKLLAVIRGRIPYPMYDGQQVWPELYRFGPQTWALRVWFFWLDLDLSHDDLRRYGTRSPSEIDQAWQGVRSVAEGGVAEKSWAERHEIPDAERVDILFSSDSLQPLYAGTDLHWRELWGPFEDPDQPLQVQIMNTRPADLVKDRRELKKVVEGWGTVLLTKVLPSHKLTQPYQPHLEVRDELDGQGKLAADPLALESHTPALLNVRMQLRFTSTDVTDG